MKHPCITLAMVATAVLVTSCGTQIQMIEAVPAKVNMARGSRVAISYKGEVPDQVGDELLALMTKDGYYTFVSGNADYTIFIQEHREFLVPSSCQVDFCVQRGDERNVLYSGTTSDYKWTLGPIESLAKEIYETFAPHEKEYKVRVSVDSKNQLLKQAVEQARKKNYAQARTLALTSLQQFPKDPETYFLLAMTERADSNFAKSNAYLKKALELKPGEDKYETALQDNEVIQTNEANVIKQLSDQT